MKFIFTIVLITAVASTEIDPKYLKCLVCRAVITELETDLAKIDPSMEMEVGGYRMDAKGNSILKKVPLIRSEIHISDTLDNICNKLQDYVRATYKSNGQLTILNLMSPSGGMNPELSKVDIIQDGDLNKSLKFYCEGIVEEYDETITSLYISGQQNIKRQLCTDIANLCSPEDFVNEDNVDVPESESDEHIEL